MYHKYLSDLAAQMRIVLKIHIPSSIYYYTQSIFCKCTVTEEVWVLQKQEDGFSTITRASDFEYVKQLCESEVELGDLWYSNYFG